MLTIDVAQLYTVVPVVFRRHLALPELHYDIQRLYAPPHIIGQIGTDSKAGLNPAGAQLLFL